VPPLPQQKIVFIGAGAAATGNGSVIVDMAALQSGLPKAELYKNVIQFDAKGQVTAARKDLFDFNKPFMPLPGSLPSLAFLACLD
jgi:malate dehydrogenase (oxaloacetate-decarboxylating)/malate dehydrogenase (oxaloacetate-decarboxylating)(NADP+)